MDLADRYQRRPSLSPGHWIMRCVTCGVKLLQDEKGSANESLVLHHSSHEIEAMRRPLTTD